MTHLSFSSHRVLPRLLLSVAGIALMASSALANPTGGQVVAGSASIQASGGVTTITQTSDKAILNWDSFSVGSSETVNFNQLSASSVALNRVVGADPSTILGTLNANGQVFLINPNGIVFGRGSKVNVGGLVASTLDIRNEDFLAGRYVFTGGRAGQSLVVEDGATITVTGGRNAVAAFLAPQFRNSGVITARYGRIGIGVGQKATLDFYGDSLISFAVNETSSIGQALTQAGVLEAGSIQMTAQAASEVVSSLITANGTARAVTASGDGGVITLKGKGATLNVAGTLDVSSAANKGGEIKVEGSTIRLVSTSLLDASGVFGGGIVTVGRNPTTGELADHTVMEAGARINAPALVKGDGGFAEVSGTSLDFSGLVTLQGSGGGKTGTLLLDPADIDIDATMASTIVTNLGGANVIVSTNMPPTPGAMGDITVNAPITYNSSNSLTLLAVHDIIVNESITNYGAGAINLIAGWNETAAVGDASTAGTLLSDISQGLTNSTLFGQLNGNSTAGSVLIGAMRDGSGNIVDNGHANAVSVGARSGAINIGASTLAIYGGAALDAYAQLGWHVPANVNDAGLGDITITTTRDVILTGGSGAPANNAYAQIGHGGPLAGAGGFLSNNNGAITINAGQNIRASGSDGTGAYVQIGHGGGAAGTTGGGQSNNEGDISLTAQDTITLMAGIANTTYVQVGHGGGQAGAFSGGTSNNTGSISITSVNGSLSLLGGPNLDDYVLVGHGGPAAGLSGTSTNGGNITINVFDTTVVTAGADPSATARFGHLHAPSAGGVLAGNLSLITGFISGDWSNNDVALAALLPYLSTGDVTYGRTGATDLVIGSALTFNSANRLSLLSSNDIILNQAITNSGTGTLDLTASRSILINASISLGGDLNLIANDDAATIDASNRAAGRAVITMASGTSITAGGAIAGTIREGAGTDRSTGNLTLNTITARTIDFSHNSSVATGGGNLVLNGVLTASGTQPGWSQPTSVTLAIGPDNTGGAFINNAGASAINPGAGNRFVIYSNNPSLNTLGGLSGSSWYNSTAYADVTGAGNRFAYTQAATLTVTADNKTREYGLANPALTGTITGYVNGDTASILTGSAAYSTPATSASNVGSYAITAAQGTLATDNNYLFAFTNGTLSVTPATLTVTANNATRGYSLANPAFSYTVSGLRNNDTASVVSGVMLASAATTASSVGSYAITASGGTGGGNYTLAYVNGSLSITPVRLTVTANNATRVYGLANPAFSYTVSGLRNNDTASVVSGVMLASSATTASNVGAYAITASGGTGGGNYTLAYVNGTLTIVAPPTPTSAPSLNATYNTVVNAKNLDTTYLSSLYEDLRSLYARLEAVNKLHWRISDSFSQSIKLEIIRTQDNIRDEEARMKKGKK